MRALNIHVLSLEGTHLIEASAGTGKTWTIAALYARLILDTRLNLKVSEILVVTFTKAATSELRDRIRNRLIDILTTLTTQQPTDAFCETLMANLAEQEEWAIRKLTRAIASFDDAAIFTIHGFCQRLLGEAAFESGADFDLEILADPSQLEREVIEDFWRQHVYPASGAWLYFLQAMEAHPDHWHKQIKAVQGRFQKVCPLPFYPSIESDEQQFMQLLQELAQCWEHFQHEGLAQLKDPSSGLNGVVLKAIVARWSKMDQWIQSDELGERVLRSIGESAVYKDVQYFMASKLKFNKGIEPISFAFFDAMQALFECAQRCVPVYGHRLNKTYQLLLEYMNEELPRRKEAQQKMAFDDMLIRVHSAVTHAYPSDENSLVEYVRRHYRAVMVDEFQDTDVRQAEIFERIYTNSELPLFFVGDPKQAIYGFRGADIHAYVAAKSKIPMDRWDTLETNQRSVPHLVEAVNTVFGAGEHAAPFVDRAIEFQSVKAASPDVVLRVAGMGEEYECPFQFLLLPQKRDKNGLPDYWSVSEASRLSAEGVAAEIAFLLTASQQAHLVGQDRHGGNIHRGLHGGDIAVLVSNGWQADHIQSCLNVYGIPSVRQVRESVFTSRESSSLLSVLAAVSRPAKRGWVQTALITELMGVSLKAVVDAAENAEKWDQYLDQFMAWHVLWRDGGFIRMFRAWLNHVGADGLNVAERLLRYVDGERRLTNLLHLAELIQAQSRVHVGIEALLAWYANVLESPDFRQENEGDLMRLESDALRVKIVTIHSSKGLEYPIVFCPYLFESRMPAEHLPAIFHDGHEACLDWGGDEIEAHRRIAARESLEERLRLLYVALTRARYRCYVAWGGVSGFHASALTWLLHGQEQFVDSDVLEAMQTHCVRYKDRQCIEEELATLIQKAPKALAISALREKTALRLEEKPRFAELTCASFQRKALRWGWRVTSFSSLISHSSHGKAFHRKIAQAATEEIAAKEGVEEADKVVIEAAVEEKERVPSVFNYPLGEIPASEAGTCVHTLLEKWCWVDQPLEPIVKAVLPSVGLSERWESVLIEMVENTVQTVLQPLSISLADVQPSSRLSEMEFTFPIEQLSSESVQSVLRDPTHGVDPAFLEVLDQWSFETLTGFMRGYIDLVFESEGRYFVADYKTNWLGDCIEAYNIQAMTEAIARSHYYMQYLIYTLAVHRYLRTRLADYRYETHYGGVVYLFLRGLCDGSGHYGVYFDRPAESLIEALDQLF